MVEYLKCITMSRIILKLVTLCGLSFLLFACNNVGRQNEFVEKISENRAVKDRSQLPAYIRLTDSERERVDSITQTTAFLNYQRVFQNYLEKSVKSVNELSADEQKAYFSCTTVEERNAWDAKLKITKEVQDLDNMRTAYEEFKSKIGVTDAEDMALEMIAICEGRERTPLNLKFSEKELPADKK